MPTITKDFWLVSYTRPDGTVWWEGALGTQREQEHAHKFQTKEAAFSVADSINDFNLWHRECKIQIHHYRETVELVSVTPYPTNAKHVK